MADVRKLKPFILKWKGGFVSDPADLGGATNKGVTIGTNKEYRKKKGLPEPMVEELKKLSDNEWTDILKTYYWDCWKADEIQNRSIANILVDWVWASDVHGIKIPQDILDSRRHCGKEHHCRHQRLLAASRTVRAHQAGKI